MKEPTLKELIAQEQNLCKTINTLITSLREVQYRILLTYSLDQQRKKVVQGG